MSVIEIAFDRTDRNSYFPPLGLVVRGTFDAGRLKDGARLAVDWPLPIPGQRVSVDLKTRTGYLIEGLWNDDQEAARELVGERGFTILPKEPQTFPGVNCADWLSKMKDLVDAGEATVVEGSIPADLSKVPGEIIKSYVRTDQRSDSELVLDKLTEVLGKLTEVLAAKE